MIEARPSRWLSPHYQLFAGDRVWTELRFDDHAGDAWFELDGRFYRAVHERPRESLWRMVDRSLRGRMRFRLEHDGACIAHAEGGGVLRARYTVQAADAEYHLREDKYRVQLMTEDGVAGHLGRRAGLSRGLWCELPEAVPAPVRVFVIWLLVCRWETLHRGGA